MRSGWQRKEDRKKIKQDMREEEKESQKKQQPSRTEPSQIASSSASTNTANSQLAQQPSRTERCQVASSSVGTTTALPSLRNIVHVCIDGLCLNQGSKVKRLRAGLGLHFLQPEYCDVSENLFGAQTNNRAEAMACLREPQQRSWDVHIPTDSKWSHDIILRLKQYHDRQWRSSTQQKLMQCDIWAMVCNVLQRQTLWPHIMAMINVPLTIRQMNWLSKQQQCTHCN